MNQQPRIGILSFVILVSACAAPDINEWPPTPVETSEEVIQQYVDRYARKKANPRIYSEIELQALEILKQRTKYQSKRTVRETHRGNTDETFLIRKRSRAEINAIKRRVYRKYESSHDRRHELRSKYGL